MRVIQRSEQASAIIETNLVSAAKASLLLLPERFTAQELYTTVAGLSYTGECKLSGMWRSGQYKRVVPFEHCACDFVWLRARAVNDTIKLVHACLRYYCCLYAIHMYDKSLLSHHELSLCALIASQAIGGCTSARIQIR